MGNLLERILGYAGEKPELLLRTDTPPPPRRFDVVSADDHVTEPPHTFTSWSPSSMRDRMPHVVRDEAGVDHWIIGDERVPLLGSDSLKGWEDDGGYLGPVNFDELHPAVYDVEERVKHMDVSGVVASLNFPSAPFGFAGTAFLRMPDREAGLAALRAYNEWHLNEWAGPHPGRIIPSQLTWLADPELSAKEIRRNAERGFKAISFSENPERLGLPSLYSGHWDPVFRACEETDTVVNLHVGSSSETIVPSKDSTAAVLGALFPLNSMVAAADWLFARIPVRFPRIKIALSEGGIGWVPMLIDRIEYMARDLDYSVDFGELTPTEVLRRNFWFTTFCDPTTMALRHHVGVDHIMIETDYPHMDSSFPDTQEVISEQLHDVPEDEALKITSTNALELYRHTLTPS